MMPSVIVTPEFDSQLAWEIMWSDPIAPEHFQMVINMYPTMIQPFTRSNTADGGSISNGANGNTNSQEEKIRDGYLPNTKRGTAFYFNDRAIENFFQENHLSYVVRAHEVPKLGFMFHFENKCITIFSCSITVATRTIVLFCLRITNESVSFGSILQRTLPLPMIFHYNRIELNRIESRKIEIIDLE
ncbi:Serine/threonine-protein phosphatase rdgC [Sarcoptes scabiei]|uniref:Serine/threonine-protein phosphatase rdgC n=1 Tax=Sarcoptes scabiei TaxID=52283 RepID=A0A834R634_SARSC|nr:Serine/threonine-protein phosphatase rdgC [Sarcoptes scabiei]